MMPEEKMDAKQKQMLQKLVRYRKEQLNQVVLKAISDPKFRGKLLEDPVATAKTMGVELMEEEASAIRNVDLRRVAGSIDDMLAPGRIGPGPIAGNNIIFNY